MLECSIEAGPNHVTFRPIGELDSAQVANARGALSRLHREPRVLLDLSAVTFIDSGGLGALIGTIRRVREEGGTIALCSSRHSIRRVLQTAGFDRIIPVVETAAQALAAMDAADRVAATDASTW